MTSPLNVCFVTAELAPLAKTGGLADVSAALSAYLHDAGHRVRVLLPRYRSVEAAVDAIEPVAGLQNLALDVAGRTLGFSIDVTRLPGRKLPVHLLRCPELYDRPGIYSSGEDEHLRFVALARAALAWCQQTGFAPDIVHCNDWHTGLLPLYLKTTHAWDRLFRNTRSVLTIHNIGYQGVFGSGIVPQLGLAGAEQHLYQDDLRAGRVNFLKTGVLYADLITAVSPTYAKEIQRPEFGQGLDGLLRERSDTVIGILNGVDYREWDPATDPLIPVRYRRSARGGKGRCKRRLLEDLGLGGVPQKMPLIGMVTRLVAQKGIDLVERVIPPLLAQRRFALAVLGSGESRYEHFFTWLQNRHRDRVCFYRGYNNRLAHWIEAGSDMFLMPSMYEPCGLNQMYSLKYGSVPIVRATGGLADSVEQFDEASGSGTGIVFRDYDEGGLAWAVTRALDLYQRPAVWRKIVDNGMSRDFSWERQGARYVEVYRRLLGQT